MAESKDHARNVELLDISGIMKTESGRKVMARILQAAGTFSPTYHQDPHRCAQLSARRDLGLWLVDELKEAAPAQYLTLLKEEMNNG